MDKFLFDSNTVNTPYSLLKNMKSMGFAHKILIDLK